VDAPFRRGDARHIGMMPAEKRDDPFGDLLGALGDSVAPAAGCLVSGEDGALGRRQPRDRAAGGFGRRSALTRNHQDAVGDIGKRCRIEPARHTQHDAGEPLGIFRRHARDVTRDRGSEMRRAEVEVIH